MRTPRGIANNNPGNIRKTPIDWRGEVPSGDLAFETFDTPEHGIRAMWKCLRNYKLDPPTVAGIISKWAPPNENNTQAYIDHVAAQMAVDQYTPLNLLDKGTCIALAVAITRHENGMQPYGSAVLERAWALLEDSK